MSINLSIDINGSGEASLTSANDWLSYPVVDVVEELSLVMSEGRKERRSHYCLGVHSSAGQPACLMPEESCQRLLTSGSHLLLRYSVCDLVLPSSQ